MLRFGKNIDSGPYLIAFAATLWIIISMIFLAFFVILNSSQFILYSFMLFILFIFIALLSGKALKYIIYLSIIVIVSGSITYMGLLDGILPEYLIGIAIIEALIISYFKIGKSDSIMLNIGIVLPAVLYSIKAGQTVAINISIIGYYLLIVSVTTIILSNSKSVEMWCERIKRELRPVVKYIAIASILSAIVVLMLPIWPSNYIETPNVPYIPLTVQAQPGTSNYSIQLNMTKYSEYLNENSSNIRLAYANLSYQKGLIDSYIQTSGQGIDLLAHIGGSAANKSIHGQNMSLVLYILPLDNSYGHTLAPRQNGSKAYQQARVIKIGNLTGSITKKAEITYLHYKKYNQSSKQEYTVLPYTYVETACPQGLNTTASIAFVANDSVSAFLMSNQEYTKAVTNSTNNYTSYLHILPGYSNQYLININKGGFSQKLNNSCINLLFLVAGNRTISITVNESYSKLSQYTRPGLTYNKSSIVKYDWFITYGIGYLNYLYKNLTVTASAKS